MSISIKNTPVMKMGDKRKGYVIMWRSAWDNPMFANDRANYLSAWMYLIAHANYKKGQIRTTGGVVDVGRGQIHTTIRHLSLIFQWDKKTVERFLQNLAKAGMIVKSSSPQGTLLTIVNYNKYQALSDSDGEKGYTKSHTVGDTAGDTVGDTDSPLLNTSNNTNINTRENTSKKEPPPRRDRGRVFEK